MPHKLTLPDPALIVLVVLDVPPRICAERNRTRPDRPPVPEPTLRQQRARLRAALPALSGEGFAVVHVLAGPEIDAVTVERTSPSAGAP